MKYFAFLLITIDGQEHQRIADWFRDFSTALQWAEKYGCLILGDQFGYAEAL
jgi:hypothetical protein